MEAIILAGGLGTRLRSEVKDIPKCMALIQDKPFMVFLIDRLMAQGVDRLIFSVGYKSQFIQDYFSNSYQGCEIVYALEETLLGTGGAVKNAIQYVKGEDVIVVNGDSIFLSDLNEQLKIHRSTKAHATLALKPMKNIERYGTVELDSQKWIVQFLEKQKIAEGLINTGTYIFNVRAFKNIEFPEKFSLERDFFEAKVNELRFMGYTTNGYFLDIGIPRDFKRAQYEIGIFQKIDKSWTLFLDRDGVINKKRDNDYVKHIDELELLPGAIDAIASLSQLFGKTVVVTNQQGIGKKLMTERDLEEIHRHIKDEVSVKNGSIDAIYHAPDLAAKNSIMRKPNIGMALQAKADFPEIDFERSIIVGDSPSDMEFGKNANMITIMISSEDNDTEYTLGSLSEFSQLLDSILRTQKI